jgi:type I restriction enzyme S subunit
MKDSGVEWLGEVPEGWGVERLKYSSLCKVSNVDKKTKEDEQNVRLCNYTDVYYNDYITSRQDFMKATAKPEEISRFCLLNNDVVITKDSEDWRDIAVPALVTETSPDIICGYHLAIIRPNSHRLLGVFLFRLMQSHAVNQQFQIASSGVTRFGLPKSSIGEAIIPVPSIPEQQAIANFLDLETGNIDLVVSKIREAISKLTDYRAALITAAVTGKIDVR